MKKMETTIQSNIHDLVISAWEVACGVSGAFIVGHIGRALRAGMTFAEAAQTAACKAAEENDGHYPPPRGVSVDFCPDGSDGCRQVLVYDSDRHSIRLWRESNRLVLDIRSLTGAATDRVVLAAMYAAEKDPASVQSDVLADDGSVNWGVLREKADDYFLSVALRKADTLIEDTDFVWVYGEDAMRAALHFGRSVELLTCPDEQLTCPELSVEEALALPPGVQDRVFYGLDIEAGETVEWERVSHTVALPPPTPTVLASPADVRPYSGSVVEIVKRKGSSASS